MNVETIRDARNTSKDLFKRLSDQRKSLNKQVAQIDAELLRLQGEYRVLSKLLEPEFDPVATVNVEKTLNESEDGTK